MRLSRLYCRLVAHEWHMPYPYTYRILVCARCDKVIDFDQQGRGISGAPGTGTQSGRYED